MREPLDDALRVGDYMSEHDGELPAYAKGWPRTRLQSVGATLREVGQIQESAAARLQAEAASR